MTDDKQSMTVNGSPVWGDLDDPCKLKGNPLAGRDLLRLLDLTPAEMHKLLSTARSQKTAWNANERVQPYVGKAVAVILEKPSLRTRVSFEVGITRLGAHPIVMSDANSAFSRGETIQDTIKVLERFVDAIVIRSFAQQRVEEIAHWASIPVINALTDDYHPCQGLADFLTMFEHRGDLSKLKLAYIGDGNNMAHTYLEGGALTGMRVSIATPQGYEPDPKITSECRALAKETGAVLELCYDPEQALQAADVVITDTWTSMGEEAEHDIRLKAFSGFQITADSFRLAAAGAIFLHCLPAHRGEEVTDEVMDAPYSAIYDEAENRLHAQKALLSLTMADI